MAQRDNLYRRSSGIYVVRIAVPARYRLYTDSVRLSDKFYLAHQELDSAKPDAI